MIFLNYTDTCALSYLDRYARVKTLEKWLITKL